MTVTVNVCGLDVQLVHGQIPRWLEHERLRVRDALWIVDDRQACRDALEREAARRGNELRWP